MTFRLSEKQTSLEGRPLFGTWWCKLQRAFVRAKKKGGKTKKSCHKTRLRSRAESWHSGNALNWHQMNDAQREFISVLLLYFWLICKTTGMLTRCPMVYVYWRPDQWSRAAFTWTFRGFATPQSFTTYCSLQLLINSLNIIMCPSSLLAHQSLTLDNENSILSIYNCTKGFKAWIYCHDVGNLSKAGRQRKKAPKEPRFMISST